MSLDADGERRKDYYVRELAGIVVGFFAATRVGLLPREANFVLGGGTSAGTPLIRSRGGWGWRALAARDTLASWPRRSTNSTATCSGS